MFETLEINTGKKKYKKALSVLVVANQQGDDFSRILDSVYNQTLAKERYEVFIVVAPDSNVDKKIIRNYQEKNYKNTKVFNIKHQCLGGLLEAVSNNKLKVSGEYITVLRGRNTYNSNSFTNLSRMSGDILVMNFSYPHEKYKKHVKFEEVVLKKGKVFAERKVGIHMAHEMTTANATAFGKAFHARLFKDKSRIPYGDDGTSLVFYSVMLSKARDVFYYSKSCGTLRHNLPYRDMTEKDITHYQDGLKFLEKNIHHSKFIDKLILMRLYWLIKQSNANIPKVVYDIDYSRIVHDKYYNVWPIFRGRKIRRDTKGIEIIKKFLGDRINEVQK